MLDYQRSGPGGSLRKVMPVTKLIGFLRLLEATDTVEFVGTGNLAILRGEVQIGHIDMGEESMELYAIPVPVESSRTTDGDER